jgi:predicted nucleic-acid-binding protein
MIAVDTNVVVRIVVNDDRAQVRRAADFIAANRVVLLTSVVMEVEWVLRSTYLLSVQQIVRSIRDFLSLETVTAENPGDVIVALDAYGKGMDFADAMHLAQAARATGFATFDRSLQRRAARLGGFVPVMVA